jgi:aminopeptidase N
MIALLLVSLCGAAQIPFSPPDSAVVRVTPTRYQLTVRIDYEQQRLEGTARITLRNFSDTPVSDIPLLVYRLMEIRAATVNGAATSWTQDVVRFSDFPQLQATHALVRLPFPLVPGDSVDVEVRYDGYLLGYAETGMAYVRDHIEPSFTVLRDDALAFPEIGYPMEAVNRRAPQPSYTYLARITVPDSLVVANGGRLVERTTAGGWATYVYESIKPSWRMDFAIADYAVIQEGPIRVVYLRRDSTGAQRIAARTRRSFDLFSTWFGRLPGAPSLTILELENGYGSQADVVTILQAAAAFRDSTRDRELYHEVAHLWNPPETDLPSPRWNEGLSSFLEYLVDEQLTGRPGAVARADQLLDWLRSIAPQRERLTRVPLVDYGKAQMTDFSYSVGALLFHLLHGVVGPERFRAIIGGFSRTYATSGASTRDLATFAIRTAGMDLKPLFDDWAFTTGWWPAIKDGTSYADLVRHYQSPGRNRAPAR